MDIFNNQIVVNVKCPYWLQFWSNILNKAWHMLNSLKITSLLLLFISIPWGLQTDAYCSLNNTHDCMNL